jgi:hypothetical protein
MSEDNKTPIEGGLLGPWSDDEEMAFRAYKAKTQEDREKEQAQAALDASALDHKLDVIDKLAFEHLKQELVALKDKSRTTARARRDYAAFRAFCSDQGLPETKPQAIFEFLVTQSDRGLARVKRLHKSIAAVQASIGHPGAADDLIIRALIQRIETEEKKENDSGSL